MRQHTSLAIALSLLSCAAAASTLPRFEDFPSVGGRLGQSAKVHLQDARSRQYATVLREAARQKPNFAGHYVLASWGCGASCTMSAAIDANTGAVAWLPFTVCCWDADITEPLDFHADSRLLVVHGSRDEHGSGRYFYAFDGQRFRLLMAQETREK